MQMKQLHRRTMSVFGVGAYLRMWRKHRGDIGGHFGGRYFSIAVGLVLYGQLLRQRARAHGFKPYW